MIVLCEKCQTEFNLDDALIKKEGSKVRCSLCKHVFMAFPPEPMSLNNNEIPIPSLGDAGDGILGKDEGDFDKLFAEPIEGSEDLEETLTEAHMSSQWSTEADQQDRQMEAYGSLEDVAEFHEPPSAGSPDIVVDEESDTLLPVDDFPEEDIIPPEYMRTAKHKPAKHVWFRVLVTIFLIIIVGAVALRLFAPGLLAKWLPFVKPVSIQQIRDDTGTNGLSFMAVSSKFFKSDKAGTLFAIQGLVVNRYPESRKFILLKGSIIDEKGDTIRVKQAYAGNTFEKETIKNMSIDEIDETMNNRAGMDNKNTNVAPDAAIPFMIVFEDLPEDMAEYTVEKVRSDPVTSN